MVVTSKTKSAWYVVSAAIIAAILLFWFGPHLYARLHKAIEPFSMPAVVTWQGTGGSGKKARIGSDGSLYSVGINDAVYRFDGAQWSPVGASFRNISVRNKNQIVGLTRTFMIYKTDDITASPVSWVRLNNSRFDDVSVGSDGTIWATVLPVGGTYGIYAYDGQGAWNKLPGSLRQVAVRTKTEAWGVAADDTVWYYKSGSWTQMDGSLKQIAVGSDGDVWGINKDSTLFHRSNQGDWQQASGTYKSIDVKDASTIVATDASDRVIIGSPKDMSSVTDPVQTPFDISAYSGGSNSYSDFQKSQVGWAALTVKGNKIIDQDPNAYTAPKPGLNVVTINEDGNPLMTTSFDTGRDSSASDAFTTFVKGISTSQTSPLEVNLYTVSNKMTIDSSNQIVFSNKNTDIIATASVTPGKFDISFNYTGDGSFSVSSAGPVVPEMPDAINLSASSNSQTFHKKISFATAGTHILQLQCVTSSNVNIKDLNLTCNSDSIYPPAMMFILASNDAGSKLSPAAAGAVQSFGGSSLGDLRTGGSYYLVYDFINGILIDEQLNNSGHVRFVSQGKYPVFDSTYSIDASNVVYMMNRDTVIGYDMSAGIVTSTVLLGNTALPQPFSKQIDTVVNIGRGKSLVLTRGQFCISVTPDFSAVLAGPDVIGGTSQMLPLTVDPFTKGLNANVATVDGNRYFFKDNKFLQTTDAMDKVISTGLFGTGDFVGLPKSFTRIHAAFPSGNDIGLVSYDKFVTYNTFGKTITSGPVDILSDKRFIGLPLSFKVGSSKPAVPFLNHTRFKGQRFKNFDISVKNAPGVPGWSPETFTKYNKNAVANVMLPPIKTKALLDKYPDIGKQYGTDENTVLTAFENYSSINGWSAPRYGGNTISFSLVDKTKSFFCSYSDAGTGYGNARLFGGEWYSLTIWVKTEDPGFSVGAFTGSPETAKYLPPHNVILNGTKTDASKGWQVMSWEFHQPSYSLASDVSFNMSQDSSVDTLHSFYGPVLKASLSRVSNDFTDDLVKQTYFYIFHELQSIYVGYDLVHGMYTTKNTSQAGSFKGQYERFCAFHAGDVGTIFLSSYAAVQIGSLNLFVSNNKLAIGPVDDETAKWVIVRQGDNGTHMLFINRATDLLLDVDANGSMMVTTCPQSIKTSLKSSFSIRLPAIAESFVSSTSHIQAAISRDPMTSQEVFLFRDGIVCSYDVANNSLLASPVRLTEHSSFQNLPSKFIQTLDAGFNLSPNVIVLFSENRFLCWDLIAGTFANGMTSSAELGPGGHVMFHRLPAPFNKHVDSCARIGPKTLVMVSDSVVLRWDIIGCVPIDDPQPLSSSILSTCSASIMEPIEAMVDIPLTSGMLLIFGDTTGLTFDALNNKTVTGPDVIGPSGSLLTDLVPPFVPSAAEVCQGYQTIIKANTDYPNTACITDPSRPFQWQDDCMFNNVSTCSDAGGVWNDASGFCGSKVSNGLVPLKNVDSSKRQAAITKYLQECKTVSEWDYQDMKRIEQSKQDQATNFLSREKKAKQSILKKLDSVRTNLTQINNQLKDAQLTLNADSDKACHPIKICLKQIDAGAGRRIPLSCSPSVITSILQKDTMSPDDITTILNVIAKTNVLNSFPIENHPDYPNYAQTAQFTQCMPNLHTKTIADFPLSSFPSYNNYISSDSLLPPNQTTSVSSSSTSPTLDINGGSSVSATTGLTNSPVNGNTTSSISPDTMTQLSNSSSNTLSPAMPSQALPDSVRDLSSQSLQNAPLSQASDMSRLASSQTNTSNFFTSQMLTPDLTNPDPALVSSYHTFIDGIIRDAPQASNAALSTWR